ncbi:MAG: FtsX-like permease family protein [Gammaproteobacteria bacterium]|nr:FtsX-like permease family protein [Gammaproteobacteria bacterium]
MTLGFWQANARLAAELGLRYAFSRRGSGALIGWVAVAGLSLSVAVLVVVLSVINGFERELRERVFGVLPHAGVWGDQPFVPSDLAASKLVAVPDVLGAAPIVQGSGLAVGIDKVQAVLLNGVEPSTYRQVSGMEGFLGPAGGTTLEVLQPDRFGVILGSRLASRLGVGVGDPVRLMLPLGSLTLAGVLPRQKRFQVVALLRSGSELDSRAAFIHLADAQRLFRLGEQVHGYQLRFADLDGANALAALAVRRLGEDRFFPRTWQHSHGNLHRAIGAQKATLFVLLAFLVGVAAFNLVSTLVMTVEQRGADIAILKTMGAASAPLIGCFVMLGALIGALGILIGVAVGTAVAGGLPAVFAWINDGLGLDLMSQYFISYLPVDIWPADLARIAVVSFVLCLTCTLYPAWRAARLLPSRVLAHE